MSATIRPAAVAGSFYPGDGGALRREIGTLLRSAPAVAIRPKALVLPHAGYQYSGPVAAQGYRLLEPLRDAIKRVVLLGPAHRLAFRGLALPGVDYFRTPLGKVPVDREAAAALADLPEVIVSSEAHAQEHSLEVHLPFLQSVLGPFSLVPLCVGDTGAAAVARVLERLWGGPETLIVVSSDLSHYHSHSAAERMDGATADDIVHLRDLASFEQACGALPVNGLLAVARRRGLQVRLLDLRNSGDTAGDRSRVVGYGAFAFVEAPANHLGPALLVRARNAIAAAFGLAAAPEPEAAGLQSLGATFVTLTRHGQLRGCIGSLEARRSLEEDVRANARAAAFSDPRFPSLSMDEWADIRVEVSLLTEPVPLDCANETDALRQLRPGKDGVIFEAGARRATFLPQVWEDLPHPAKFLARLKQKAGLPMDYWSPQVRLWRYEVRKWTEPNPD